MSNVNSGAIVACNRIYYILVGVITIALAYTLRSIIIPFLIGAIFAYIGNILVIRLESKRIPHIYAVILSFLLVFFSFILAILLLVPFVQNQIATLNAYLPKIFAWTQNNLLPWFDATLPQEKLASTSIKNMMTENFVNADVIKWLLQTALKSGQTLFEIFMFMILIPVVSFYLMRDWDRIGDYLILFIPKHSRQFAINIGKECEEVLLAFFRGQVIVITILSVIYSLGFYLIGLQLGIAIGVLTGLLSLVPYLGMVVGAIIASIAAFVQFGTLSSIFWALLVIVIGHVIDNLFLTPSLLGERIGLHPVLVIFAVLAGGLLLGFIGILLALPLAAVILVVMRHLYNRYGTSN